jgi:hypothetical protein
VHVKTGKFSNTEKQRLVEIITAYMDERGQTLDDFVRILFKLDQPQSEQTESGRGRYAIFRTLFSSLAEELGRTKSAVYDCVVRLLHPSNHLGAWSPEEDAQLMEQYQALGPQWVRIGKAVGRSSRSVRDRHRVLKWSASGGPWTREETDKLIAAVGRVREVAQDEGTWCWEWITAQVASRSLWQVRRRWAHIEVLARNDYKRVEWGPDNDKLLVQKIFGLAASDDSEIVWMSIAADWPFSTTPAYLYNRWHCLRRRVRNHATMSTDDIASELLRSM